MHSCRENLKGKKGKKFKNRIFGGYVISTLPKFGQMLGGPSRPPSGETWSTKCTSVGVKTRSKKFSFFSEKVEIEN